MNKKKKDKKGEFCRLFDELHIQYQEELRVPLVTLKSIDIDRTKDDKIKESMSDLIHAVGELEAFRKTISAMGDSVEDARKRVWGKLFTKMIEDGLMSEKVFVAKDNE